jgi:RND family efflux transporter MFP subunit
MLPEGTSLLRVDPVDYELSLAQARAELAELEVQAGNTRASLAIEQSNLELAQREQVRIGKLAKAGTASQSNADEAQRAVLNSRAAVQNLDNSLALLPTKRKVLEAKMAQVERDLANTHIQAPFNMRVASLQVEADQYVAKGQSLFQGDAIDRVEVVAQVPLSALRNLFIGREDIARNGELHIQNVMDIASMSALIRLDLGNHVAEWQAEFVRFSDNVDAATRTMGVVVAVDRPFDKVKPGYRPPLSKGMFVQVVLRGKPQPGHVVVPRSAIRSGALLLVADDNRLKRQPVTVLYEQGGISVIAKGVEAGQKVVVSDIVPAVEGMLLHPVEDTTLNSEIMAAARGGQ